MHAGDPIRQSVTVRRKPIIQTVLEYLIDSWGPNVGYQQILPQVQVCLAHVFWHPTPKTLIQWAHILAWCNERRKNHAWCWWSSWRRLGRSPFIRTWIQMRFDKAWLCATFLVMCPKEKNHPCPRRSLAKSLSHLDILWCSLNKPRWFLTPILRDYDEINPRFSVYLLDIWRRETWMSLGLRFLDFFGGIFYVLVCPRFAIYVAEKALCSPD